MLYSDNSNIGFTEENGASKTFDELYTMREEYYNWSNEMYEGVAMKEAQKVTISGKYL